MTRAARQISVCAVILLLVCVFGRLFFFKSYDLYMPLERYAPNELRQEELRFTAEDPSVLSPDRIVRRDGMARISVSAQGRGESDLQVRDQNGEVVDFHFLRVGAFNTVYDVQTGGFTGDAIVLVSVTLLWLIISAIMIWNYYQARGPAYYSYSTVYYAGFSIFSLFTGLMMVQLTISHFLNPVEFSMLSVYQYINGASRVFMEYTSPLVILFAIGMGVSNIALIRHEGRRFQNMLGLFVSLVLLVGEGLGLYLFFRDFMGSEWEYRVNQTVENTYATLFVYFECMLAGAEVCGITASRRQPMGERDFIIILGCRFRRDGSLPPLLRGRVDKAIEFWKHQKETGGKEAHFIPSGGQGKDESMPEAEAIRRYLISREVPDDLIHPETKSVNTYQNMAFSRKVMEEINPAGTAVFSTTSYHVFRSGVWAARAGLKTEGIGAKTRWWFWPNAFMREVAGLMKARWKQELALLVILVLYFGALSMALF